MARSAADQASDAAEALSAWLDQRQGAAAPDAVAPAPAGEAEVGAPPEAAVPDAPAAGAAPALTDREEAVRRARRRRSSGMMAAPVPRRCACRIPTGCSIA